MKQFSISTFGLAVLFALPIALSAKGNTVKIVIKGADLSAALEITDPKVADFNVWSGPGCAYTIHGVMTEETEGFIIDWPKGIVANKPAALQHYEVAFYTFLKGQPPAYVVLYDYDPTKEQGLVYLPGPGDRWYGANVFSIAHGHDFEGHWLRATGAWESFVRPLIAKAKAEPSSR
jgi:hypothetical protein